MVPNKLENGAQHAMKWRPVSWKMVPNVVLINLIAVYLYLSSLNLHFTCLFYSQSFKKV